MPYNAAGQWLDDAGNPGVPPPGTPPWTPPPTTPVIPTMFPPKAEHETTVESRIGSPEAEAARLKTTVAEGNAATAHEVVTDVNVRQAGGAATAATAEADALVRQKKEQADADKEERRSRDEFISQQKAGIAEEVESKRKAGAANADFWKGNAAGEVAVAIFRAIQEGIQSYKGGSGPTGAERIVEASMAAHEKKLVGEWEATVEARKLKKDNFTEWEKGVALQKVAAANQSAAEIGVIRAKAEAFAKNLDPEKQRAVGTLTQRLEELGNRRSDQTYAQGFDKTRRATDRSPAGSAGAGPKLASADTRSMAAGSAEYDRLAARNIAIMDANRGAAPVMGPEATEWETNNTAMAKILQEPLGKSDSDAVAADKLQSTPGLVDKLAAKVGVGNSAENYKRALSVNADRLRKKAADLAAGEGKSAPVSTRDKAAQIMGVKPAAAPAGDDPNAEAKAYLKEHPTGPGADRVRKELKRVGVAF